MTTPFIDPRLAKDPLAPTQALLDVFNVLSTFLHVPTSLVPMRDMSQWYVVWGTYDITIMDFEAMFGQRDPRHVYNGRNADVAIASGRSVLGTFRGLSDLVVPVTVDGKVQGILFAGPFGTRELTAEEIAQQWRELSGRSASSFDPLYVSYARCALATQVLIGAEVDAFRETLELAAHVVGDQTDVARVRARLRDLRTTCFSKLPSAIQFKAARFLDPVLNAASKDDRLSPWEAEELDLERMPNVVMAVLPYDVEPGSADLVRSLVRADRFQRRCAEFSRTLPQTLCARLEDHGAYFLTYLDPRTSKSATRAQLEQHSRKIAEFVHDEFGVRAVIGVGPKASLAGEVAQTAKQAVLAMQLAVHRNVPVVFYEDEKQDPHVSADRQRERPRSSRYANQLLAQFSNADFAEMELTQAHYVRQVLEESGGRAAVMRVYFEHFLFSLLELVQKRAQLDNRTLDELEHNLSTALGEALTTFTLLTVCRHWFDNLLHISREPGKGQKELRLERAALYIKENCHRPLSLEEVARQVGFSTNYFSRIFKGAFGTGFAQHVLQQRLERAKELLRKSTLPIHHVSRESGFASVTHFCGVFKQATRHTPQQYRDRERERAPRERPRRARSRIRAVRGT